ncbi:MAG: CapA family protein, partial [Chrysiogenales bacterium]
PVGMADTLDFLYRHNIKYSGGGSDLAAARVPARLQYGDTIIYVFSYCSRPPEEFYAGKNRPGIAPLDIEMIRDDIASYKTPGSLVFISLHWGIEQTHVPQSYQIVQARQIIDAGADAIIGHHPHWPQGIEIYRGKPIIYSLGNFINGYTNAVERDNIGVVFYYSGDQLERIKVIPIAGRNRKIRYQPYVLAGNEAEECLKIVSGLSKHLGTDIEIAGDYGFIDMMRSEERIGMRD